MKVIRGVNIYPSAIDAVLHEIPEVTEFQVIEKTDAEMEEIEIEVELAKGNADSSPSELVSALESKLRDRFSIRIPVSTVDPGSLPRYEFKAKRWIKR